MCSKVFCICFFLSLQAVNALGQDIERLRERFPVLPSAPNDSLERDYDKDFNEWLKAKPLVADTMQFSFQDVLEMPYTPRLSSLDVPPKPTLNIDPSLFRPQKQSFQIMKNTSLRAWSTQYDTQMMFYGREATADLQFNKNAFMLTGGVTVGKYKNFRWQKDMLSLHANAEYRLSNAVSLGVAGTFVPAYKHVNGWSPMMPSTGFSAYTRIRITSWLSLQPTVSRYYDYVRRKWATMFSVIPVIDFGNLLHLKSKKKERLREKTRRVIENY